MSLDDLERELSALGVTSFKAFRSGGLCWAICPRGVGVGDSLALAISHMVAIVKERADKRAHDGTRPRIH